MQWDSASSSVVGDCLHKQTRPFPICLLQLDSSIQRPYGVQLAAHAPTLTAYTFKTCDASLSNNNVTLV